MSETSVADPQVTQPAEATMELKVSDRCEQGGCGAQAYVRATITTVLDDGVASVPLLFCRHHYLKNAEALAKANAFIHDESHKINAKAGAST
jgi:hypothetical protein